MGKRLTDMLPSTHMTTLSVSREIETKSILRYYYMLIRIAKTNITGEDLKQPEHIHCCWEHKMARPLWRAVCRTLPQNPPVLLLDMFFVITKLVLNVCSSSTHNYLELKQFR